RLHQERWRRLPRDRNVRIQSVSLTSPQMARINCNSKIWTAAFLVSRIARRVQTSLECRADLRHEVSTGRKPKHANLVRIDVPLRGMQSHQTHRPLRIL